MRLIRENLLQQGIKVHYKLRVIKIVELSQEKTDQQEGIVRTERHLNILGHLISHKGGISKNVSYSINRIGKPDKLLRKRN